MYRYINMNYENWNEHIQEVNHLNMHWQSLPQLHWGVGGVGRLAAWFFGNLIQSHVNQHEKRLEKVCVLWIAGGGRGWWGVFLREAASSGSWFADIGRSRFWLGGKVTGWSLTVGHVAVWLHQLFIPRVIRAVPSRSERDTV